MADPNKTGDAAILYTEDPTKAQTVAEKNEFYDEDYTKEIDAKVAAGTATGEELRDPRYGIYVRPDRSGTNVEAEANQAPVENPDYDPYWNCKYLKEDGTGTNDETKAASALYFRGVAVDSTDPADLEKMDYFTKGEKKYLDVGLGHKEQDGEAISSTVFNSALQGIYYLGGYGTSMQKATVGTGDTAYEVEREVPNNMVSIMNRMSEILLRCNTDDGDWASTEDEDGPGRKV